MLTVPLSHFDSDLKVVKYVGTYFKQIIVFVVHRITFNFSIWHQNL